MTSLPQLDGSRPREAGSGVGGVGVVSIAGEGGGRDDGLPVARVGVQDEARVGVGQIGQGGAGQAADGLLLLGRAVLAEDGRWAGITVVALERTFCYLSM